jgi:aspartate racemase
LKSTLMNMEDRLPKRRLGIVGGMGSPAGAWLFNKIISLADVSRDQDYPEIIVHSNSRIPDRTEAILGKGHSSLPELQRSIGFLNECRVEVAALACMTAYYYYKDLAVAFNGRLINPMDVVFEKITSDPATASIQKIGLIGSSGLLRSGIYQERFKQAGYEIITLDDEDQQKYFMHPIYMAGGIKSGVFTMPVKDLFWKQVDLLKQKGAEAVIGACSEVPLVLDREFNCPFYNAFELLAMELTSACYQ